MDVRKGLPPNTVLPLPGMNCSIETEVGRGSNAIVYRATYPDLLDGGGLHTVLVKELFPFHTNKAIYRNDEGEVVYTEDGIETWNRQRRSFENGNLIHLRLLRRHPELVGANVNSFPYHGTFYTVLGYTGGRSLNADLRGAESDLRKLTARMLMLLDALEDFHEEGYLHLDIAPDNILIVGDGRRESVMLIDYNSVHAMRELAQEQTETLSVKAGYTAPEIRTGNLSQIQAASDLYSVAAVFYRCLTGNALTTFQMIRPVPPDVSSCPALQSQPETVCAMVRQILRRGLQSLPSRRYAMISEMRQAFQELLDRIDGIGVTHWALWEAAQKNANRMIRNNPSLHYILDEKDLFPSSVKLQDSRQVPVEAYIEQHLRDNEEPACLIAPGGMGKTTALLRTAFLRTQHYSPAESAVAYIPLYGYHESDVDYLSDQLLADLRFKADTKSYAAARHNLWQLLDKPLRSSVGDRPVLLLLLDGYNEISCSTTNLLAEIRRLSQLRGVCILISSRVVIPDFTAETAELSALREEDVAQQLAQNNLLVPKSEEIRELLKNPLMLSLFLRISAAGEKQPNFETGKELIAGYFEAIKDKAIRELPEDDPKHWQLEAALALVLPALAGLLKTEPAADGLSLLRETKHCYRLLSDRILLHAFPQWIGHSRDIKGTATDAEEWYGIIVHDLLWRQLGLLVRTEADSYQIPHEILRDHLAQQHRNNIVRLKAQRRIRNGIILLLVLTVLGLCASAYMRYFRPQPYDDGNVEAMMAISLDAYDAAGNQYEDLTELLQSAEKTPDDFKSAYAKYQYHLKLEDARPRLYSVYPEDQLEITLGTGSVVSWSGEPLDAEHYRELLNLVDTRKTDYMYYAEILAAVIEDEKADKYAAQYMEALNAVLEADADITAVLFQLVCIPHMTKYFMEDTETGKAFMGTYAENSLQNQHLIEGEPSKDTLVRELKDMEKDRDSALTKMNVAKAWYQRNGESKS